MQKLVSLKDSFRKGEQDGRGVGERGVHLSPQIYQEHPRTQKCMQSPWLEQKGKPDQ